MGRGQGIEEEEKEQGYRVRFFNICRRVQFAYYDIMISRDEGIQSAHSTLRFV